MKTSEQGLREWALDQITFDAGQGRIVVLTRQQVQRLHDAIVTKKSSWDDVGHVLVELINMEMRGREWGDSERASDILGIDKNQIQELQRAVKSGRMRLTPIDLVRYGGMRAACEAVPPFEPGSP